MGTDSIPEVPTEIRSDLDEIADRLWSGHAAVMVGAGFSRNASPTLPDWRQLADRLYAKAHGVPVVPEEARFLNPLRLASEVEAGSGRPVLDDLLRTAIQDAAVVPSELHTRLMELPWADVFTVNYDSLLERASSRYQVVREPKDLVWSTRPRIVKLHGTLPGDVLIATEEDYRTYPRKFAAFVNAVQQALMENTFCLIGFSADDPNFLQWSGWIRDNLDDSAPRPYLLALSSHTTAQKRLLGIRKINLVDLSGLGSSGGAGKGEYAKTVAARDETCERHKMVLGELLAFLESRKPRTEVPAYADWPRGNLFPDRSKPQTAESVARDWAEQRESCPNWVVVPEGPRESLSLGLRIANYGLPILEAGESISPPADLTFLHELNWRLEHVLCPIPNELAPHYERILARYNPYPDVLVGQSAEVTPSAQEYSELDWRLMGQSWLDLGISLLRFYREEAMPEKWAETDSRLQILSGRLSPEQAARWHYERCLQALFLFDFSEVRKRVNAWSANPSQPFWDAKRAGLLAELGDLVEAEGILEDSLAAIRSKQQLAPVISDFTWVSQEGHVMHLLHLVRSAKRVAERQPIEDQGTQQQFRQRWHELKQYRCDPWGDLELFGVRLKASPVHQAPVTRQKEFDIGREIVTHHMGGSEEGPLLGYAFLRYCEEVGLPFTLSSLNVAKSQAQHAAERIAQSSSPWAVTTLLRIGDAKLADSSFGRDALAAMSVARVDAAVDRFLGIFKQAQPLVPADERLADRNVGARVVQVIPEILSRLCTKCSPTSRDAVFALLMDLYRNPALGCSDGISHLTERLLASCSAVEVRAKLTDLLDFPLFGQASDVVRHRFPEPFAVLAVSNEPLGADANPEIPEKTVGNLLEKVASAVPEERSRASCRMGRLFEWGLLGEDHTCAFGAALWAQTGENGFPVSTPFYTWAFLTFPSPPMIDVLALFKQYVLDWTHEAIDAAKGSAPTLSGTGKEPVVITRGRIGWCTNVLGATKRGNRGGGPVDWSREEAGELLEKLAAWWDAGKERLREPEGSTVMGSVRDEFRARYRNLVPILADVIAPRVTAESPPELKNRLRQLMSELDQYGIPALRARVASLHFLPDDVDGVLQSLASRLAGSEEGRLRDTFEAIIGGLRSEALQSDTRALALLSDVVQQVKWRREATLVSALRFMHTVVTDMPELLTDTLTADVLSGLSELLLETGPLVGAPFPDIADRLFYRENAAALAHALYERFSNRDTPIAPVLLEWQSACADQNEFAEVRNQWRE